MKKQNDSSSFKNKTSKNYQFQFLHSQSEPNFNSIQNSINYTLFNDSIKSLYNLLQNSTRTKSDRALIPKSKNSINKIKTARNIETLNFNKVIQNEESIKNLVFNIQF